MASAGPAPAAIRRIRLYMAVYLLLQKEVNRNVGHIVCHMVCDKTPFSLAVQGCNEPIRKSLICIALTK